MNVYIELHSEKHGQILGNLDGQGLIDWAKQYKRTEYYRNLPKTLEKAKAFRKDNTLFYRVVNKGGDLLEVIK
jgi:hypothetical protein